MPATDRDARRDALKAAHPRYRHWEVLLTVEDDLKNISRYVDICEDNYKTYSIELASLIIRSCTEIEKLCKRITGLERNAGIGKFLPSMLTLYPELPSFHIAFFLWSIGDAPWKWATNAISQNPTSIPWWAAYNDIKHDKGGARKSGNLENCLDAIGALYVTTLYYERFIWGEKEKDGKEIIRLPFYSRPKFIEVTDNNIISADGGYVYSWQPQP